MLLDLHDRGERLLLRKTHDASRREGRKSVPLPQARGLSKSIDGLAALVELDIKLAVFDPVLFVFLNRARNRVKILYWSATVSVFLLKLLDADSPQLAMFNQAES